MVFKGLCYISLKYYARYGILCPRGGDGKRELGGLRGEIRRPITAQERERRGGGGMFAISPQKEGGGRGMFAISHQKKGGGEECLLLVLKRRVGERNVCY